MIFINRIFLCIIFSLSWENSLTKNDGKNNSYGYDRNRADISLWIDERQVKMFSGLSMEIFVILNGQVLPYIMDPNLSQLLPVIPSEVRYVNFTWKSNKKYFYNFNILNSSDPNILEPPIISINTQGRVHRKAKEFSILLPCSGNSSGIATFEIGLEIRKGKVKGPLLKGTPLRLTLKKECAHRGPDPECDKKCANEGWCNREKICQCPEGYMGQYCKTALCYPQCVNGGNCTAPGICSCPPGYEGRNCEIDHVEGGICKEKCLNGGKCMEKVHCECSKGYFGVRCEHSKCVIPCLNNGKCKGVNKCRCPEGVWGNHCEIGKQKVQRSMCRVCKHGICRSDNTCKCHRGWQGRHCNREVPSD